MPNRYDDLYAWMNAAFGEREFTSAEFTAIFPSTSTGKVLHDLTRLGYTQRLRRGLYRLVPPVARVEMVIASEPVNLQLPERSGLPYAYCESTAIAVWTDGGYWTGITRGFRPVHLRVRAADLGEWKKFFRRSGARASSGALKGTMYGTLYRLHPVRVLRRVRHGAVGVIRASEAHDYAAKRPYSFEPVLEMLSELAEREG